MSSSKLRSKKRTRWKFLTLCRLRGRVEITIGKWKWKRKKPKKTKTVLHTGTQGKIDPNSCSTMIKLSRSKQSSSSWTQGMATSGTNHGGNRPYFRGLHDDRSFVGR